MHIRRGIGQWLSLLIASILFVVSFNALGLAAHSHSDGVKRQVVDETTGLDVGFSLNASTGAEFAPMVIASAAGDRPLEQGRADYYGGRYVQAVESWQQAVAQYQSEGDTLLQAMALSYLALAYQQLGNWPEANQSMASSQQLLKSSSRRQPTYHRIAGQVFNTQGSLQFAQGQPEQALTSWQLATAAYEQAGEHQYQMGSLINQAQAQQSLGLFLQARQTLETVKQSLDQQPDSALKVIGLQNLGQVLLQIGELRASRQVLEESLAIAQQLEETNPERAAEINRSQILASLGNVARAQRDTIIALEYYQGAIAQAKDRSTLVQTQLNQLSLLLEFDNQPVATLVDAIQSEISQLAPSRARVYAYINYGQSLMKWGLSDPTQSSQLESASRALAMAVQQARELGDRRAEAYALGYLGRVYEANKQWSEAQRLTEQALSISQALNASDISYQWQWQLGRLLKAQDKIVGAIAAYETAYLTLQSIQRDLLATNPELQFSFQEGVEPIYREFVDLLIHFPTTEASRSDNLKQARQVIESLQVAELDNFFRTACLEGQIVAIDEIDQTGAAVIYPIILPDHLEIILSLPDQELRHYTTNVSKSHLEETLLEWRFNLERPFTTPEGKQFGEDIFNWLIRPLQSDLAQSAVDTLVFVLDGTLRNVPMAALYDGEKYLIEYYNVALAPGLQLLNPQPLANLNLEVLAAGLTEERHGFGALRNVAIELENIKASEVPSQILLNQEFTSSTLQNQINASPFPVVHLATHGQFSSDANNTFILAWDKPIPVNELNSLLRDRDTTQPEAIELLILSACETAEGDQRAALGIAGFAVQAGARSTLASLWSIDDTAAAVFIDQFYDYLIGQRKSKAEALRLAQESMLHDPNYRHPIYWAPYVLLGNWL